MSKLKAGRSFPYQLTSQRGQPDADTFELRVLSGESNERLGEITSDWKSAIGDKAKIKDLQDEAISLAVASWPWEGTLRSVITDSEVWELIGAAITGARLSADERKKFVLQPSLEMDSYASDAPASASTE